MKLKTTFYALFILTVPMFAMDIPHYSSSYLDSMSIHIEAGENRPYVYSGEGSAFFYGTTGDQVNGHMGFYYGEYKLWNDFEIALGGEILKRSEAAVDFMPHKILFRWKNGFRLEILPLTRDRNYLRFKFKGINKTDNIIFNFYYASDISAQNEYYFPIVSQLNPEGRQFFSMIFLQRKGSVELIGSRLLHAELGRGYSEFVFLYDDTKLNLINRLHNLKLSSDQAERERIDWCLEEINRSYFRCNDETVNKALNWMKISLASLFAENGSALYAGLPWFNDCWGRDTFISLPGACLVQGKFDYAKRLLQRFADWQCKDSTSSDYGRIPNRVRAGEIVYNTADGTPWFIRELYEYGLYSGGWNFVRENFDVVLRALQGTMIYHTDDFGFLTHGDAETWMDAVGPDGPWTPRGNRAVEIQALWIAQLESTIRMAERIGWQDTTQISEWKEYLKRLRKNYRQYFINEDYKKGLYDHLNTDGSPDLQVRPNQLFAFTIPLEPIDYNPFTMSDPFYEVAMYSAGIVAKEARYKYGIASLSVNDENFHPYHQFPLYPKDAAYHNGIIWTWLSGAYKSIPPGGGDWKIAESEMDLVLHQGAPGTLCEVMDVVPREGETIPRLSGTVTQAWSLAEFIRTFYQNTIGVKTVYFNNHRVGDPIEITPHLPMSLGNFQTVLNIREGKVLVSLAKTDSLVAFTFQTIQRAPQETLIRLFGSKQLQFDLSKDTLCVLNLPYSEHYDRLDTTQVIYQNERGNTVYTSVFYYNDPQYQPIEPQMPKNLKCLQPPGHRLLSGAEVKAYNPQAQIICDISDPTGDDIGDGNYLYPTEANFQPGILDLTRFVTRYDEDNVYFRLEFLDLVQPGWHPEYGFQLTFAAICIRTGEKSKGDDAVGHNSNWQLQKGYEADRFIYVGGGILVEDGGHKILAEHIPWEAGYELGNAEEKRINFALPRTLLPGAPENWKITVLIGSQDDHGGAGIGEFRNVEEKAGRWVGGGGKEGGSNVYDWAKFPK